MPPEQRSLHGCEAGIRAPAIGRQLGVAMDCLLCTLEQRTDWYMETPQWVILQCDTCGVPMAVWRQHTEEIPPAEKRDMLAALAQVADRELGEGRWRLDGVRRMIPEHPHWHARGPWW